MVPVGTSAWAPGHLRFRRVDEVQTQARRPELNAQLLKKGQKDHRNETKSNPLATGSLVFRSALGRADRSSIVRFHHSGKSWPAARSTNRECAFARSGADRRQQNQGNRRTHKTTNAAR